MSEAMGLERMTELLAQFRGYLTETRVPVLGKTTRSGGEKTDLSQGDVDVVGLGPGSDGHLLVAECKGYGGPEAYPTWLLPKKLAEIEDMVSSAAENIASMSHPRWGPEYARRTGRPDVVWVVIPGSFAPGSDPARWRQVDGYEEFVAAMSGPAQRVWAGWDQKTWRSEEGKLLSAAEAFLAARYRLAEVRLFPVHVLIEELAESVAADMVVRRKRYADPAVEMLRWMVRTTRAECLDLGALQARLRA